MKFTQRANEIPGLVCIISAKDRLVHLILANLIGFARSPAASFASRIESSVVTGQLRRGGLFFALEPRFWRSDPAGPVRRAPTTGKGEQLDNFLVTLLPFLFAANSPIF